MANQDVERFVGLLVSDEDFVQEVQKDFDKAIKAHKINLDKREAILLKEGIDTYTHLPTSRAIVGRGGTVAVPVAAAVGAAVAGAVAAEVATKVVDKLMDSRFVNPINERIRDLIISRGQLTKRDFNIH